MKKVLAVIAAFFASISIAFAAVNVNTATKEELMTLNGIGEVKAQAIIDYRTKNGPFKTFADVDKVPGIGEGTMKKIEKEVTLSGKTTVTAAPAKADEKKASPAKEEKKAEAKPAAPAKEEKKADKKSDNGQAERIIALLGGRENIVLVDACMTRLRVTVKDPAKVADLAAWKAEGALSLLVKGDGIQAVYGPKADVLKSDINDIL